MNEKQSLWKKPGARTVQASILSILIGMLAGGVIVLFAGIFSPELDMKSVWEGIRLVVAGLFSTGRSAAGAPQSV